MGAFGYRVSIMFIWDVCLVEWIGTVSALRLPLSKAAQAIFSIARSVIKELNQFPEKLVELITATHSPRTPL